jgi:phenylalanyl-tRNA synthetase beta subunit
VVSAALTGTPTLSKWFAQSAGTQDSGSGSDSRGSSGFSKINSSSELDFFALKAIVENLLDHLHVNRNKVRYSGKGSSLAFFHPAKSAKIIYELAPQAMSSNGSGPTKQSEPVEADLIELGVLGQIHPAIANGADLAEETYLFQLKVDALKRAQEIRKYEAISAAPVVWRDLTVDLPKTVEHAAVSSCINALALPYFKFLELISIFDLNDQDRSLSYRLTFQHPEQTLRNEDVDAQLNSIRAALRSELQASFRA